LIVCWMVLLLMVLDVRRIRYVIPALPMLALMAAYGMPEVGNPRITRHLVSCAVVSALVTAIFGYLPFLTTTSAANLKAAGEYLNTLNGQRVEVIVLPQRRSVVNPMVAVPILDLFTAKDIVLAKARPGIARPVSIETSPVRFTWEALPARYPGAVVAGPSSTAAVVVISDGNDRPVPEPALKGIARHDPIKTFALSDRVFRYKTVVAVYPTAQPSAP